MLGNIHPPALCIDHTHFLFSLVGYGLQTLLKSALKEGTESYYSNHNGMADVPLISFFFPCGISIVIFAMFVKILRKGNNKFPTKMS